MKSQNQMILEALQAGEAITAIDALNRFRCFRLAARIRDLRDAGHDIQSIQKTTNGKNYAVYKMEQPK